jgi:transketolase
VIALSRQKIPFVTETLARKNMSKLGGYELRKNNLNPEVTLIASGSEVQIAIEAFNKLQNMNINSKVVSMPCQELFDKQTQEYKEKIIEKNSIKISIEAGNIFGWEKYVGSKGFSLGVKSFGKSAPYKKIYEHFNLTVDNVVKTAKKMLDK